MKLIMSVKNNRFKNLELDLNFANPIQTSHGGIFSLENW
jgi:hypothetical protein